MIGIVSPHMYQEKYWFGLDGKNEFTTVKRRSDMIHFEDSGGKKHALRPEDVSSIEQKEKDGNFFLSSNIEGTADIEINEITYNELISYLSQDYDGYWEQKMETFSGLLKEEEAGKDTQEEYDLSGDYKYSQQPYEIGSSGTGDSTWSTTITSNSVTDNYLSDASATTATTDTGTTYKHTMTPQEIRNAYSNYATTISTARKQGLARKLQGAIT